MLSRLESSLRLLQRLNDATARGDVELASKLRALLDERDRAGGYDRALAAQAREVSAARAAEWNRANRGGVGKLPSQPIRLAWDERFLE